jgi:hypothetical protein
MPTNLTGTKINVTFGQLLHVDGGPTATEKTVYSGTGVATALKIGTVSISATFSAITFLNKATARAALDLGTMATQPAFSVAITGGTIDDVNITNATFGSLTLVNATSITTSNLVTGVTLTGNTLAADGTDANIDINITPKGTGEVNLTKVDIDAGSIDGTTVGATTPASVKGTTVEATTSIGYPTGTGGSVTQATSRTTGVTLNKITGQITLFAGSLGGHDADEFTLTNSTIAANDVVALCIKSGVAEATRKYYQVNAVAVGAGSCVISVGNIDNATIPASSTDSPVLQFVVLKGAVA